MKINEADLRRSQFSYFLGKIVTIQTVASSINYDASERGVFLHFRSFGGICEGFDEFGVWLKHLDESTKSFVFYSQIVGIVEEKPVAESDPVVKEALKIRTEDDSELDLSNLSIDDLQKILEENRR